MKRTIWIAAFLAVGVTLGGAINHLTAQAKEPPPAARVAVVDISRVFRNYQKTLDYHDQQRAESQRLQAENDAKLAAIEKATNVLADMKTGTADYEKQEELIDQLTLQHRNWQATLAARQQRLMLQRTREMYDDIVKATAVIAQKQGCNLVMTREPADITMRSMEEFLDQLSRRKVLYVADNLDITGDVLQHLNEMYLATKRK